YRDGASLTQTAALFGLSKSAVHQAFTRYDLPRRPPRVNRGPLPAAVRPPDDAPPWPVPVGRVPARPEQDWHTRAACADLPTDLFYPNHNIQTVKDIDRRVVDACNRCPVLPDCLAVGLHETHGIWGGHATEDRARLRRRLGRRKTRTCTNCKTAFSGRNSSPYCSEECRERRAAA
ncbi:MAG: hypothetical protein GEU92_21385, partial [Alphaproteobacteria bacterium]|nr:hypothetical protein [Alphaproteobacteria bacterium]